MNSFLIVVLSDLKGHDSVNHANSRNDFQLSSRSIEMDFEFRGTGIFGASSYQFVLVSQFLGILALRCKLVWSFNFDWCARFGWRVFRHPLQHAKCV